MWTLIIGVAIYVVIYFAIKKSVNNNSRSSNKSPDNNYLYEYEKELAGNFYLYIHSSSNMNTEEVISVFAGNIYSYGIMRLNDKKIINYFMNQEEYGKASKSIISDKLRKKFDDTSIYDMSRLEIENYILGLINSIKVISERAALLAAMKGNN